MKYTKTKYPNIFTYETQKDCVTMSAEDTLLMATRKNLPRADYEA